MTANPDRDPAGPKADEAKSNPSLFEFGSRPTLGGVIPVLLASLLFLALLFGTYALDHFALTAISIAVFLGFMHVAGRLNLVALLTKNPLKKIGLAVLYIAIGVCWMVSPYYPVGYWGLYYKRAAREADYAKVEWLIQQGVDQGDEVPKSLQADWERFRDENPQIFKAPKVRDNRGRLIWAGALWPVSVTHAAFADVIVEGFNRVLDLAEDWMDRMAREEFEPIREERPGQPVPAVDPAPIE